MAAHAEDALGRACIAQVLDLSLAVPAAEAGRAERLVAGEDGEVFDLVAAGVAAVGAVVADERAIAEEQEVGVGVEEGAAGVAAETIDMPSVARCGVEDGSLAMRRVRQQCCQNVTSQGASGKGDGNLPLRSLCTGTPHLPDPRGHRQTGPARPERRRWWPCRVAMVIEKREVNGAARTGVEQRWGEEALRDGKTTMDPPRQTIAGWASDERVAQQVWLIITTAVHVPASRTRLTERQSR
nr:hypothetical protein CFP56_16871 [Quercus suber]